MDAINDSTIKNDCFIVIWLWFMISKNMEYFWKVLYACILKSVFTYMHIGNIVV